MAAITLSLQLTLKDNRNGTAAPGLAQQSHFLHISFTVPAERETVEDKKSRREMPWVSAVIDDYLLP